MVPSFDLAKVGYAAVADPACVSGRPRCDFAGLRIRVLATPESHQPLHLYREMGI
jgi:hypothetical protein